MVFVIIIVLLLLFLVYLVKLNHDLLVNKDNILRSLAALDATIIRKNTAILEILGYAQDTMLKEGNLIKELFTLRHDINKIRPKIANAAARYQMQIEFDKKVEFLMGAFVRYPELSKNAGFQKCLQDYMNIENMFNEKVEQYNLAVDRLNWSIESFPSSLLAKASNTKEPPPRYEK